MRVAFYTHPFFLEPALHFVQEMAKMAEVHLYLELAPSSTGSLLASTPDGLPTGVHDGDALLGGSFPPGVRRYWAGAKSFKAVVYGNRRTIDPRTVPVSLEAIRNIRAIEPDIIHLDDGSLRLAMAGPKLPRVSLLNVHDPVPHTGDTNRRIQLARRLVASKVDRYRLHGESFREPFVLRTGIDPDRVDVALLGVYDVFREWADDAIERDQKTVLFAGRLAAYKGLEVLYEAAPIVASAIPDVRFVVAGRPVAGYVPPNPPVLPNGGRVEVMSGHVPNEQLAALHQRATVVACPYIDATQSGVVLTAFAFGTPVVATSVGAMGEYVENEVSGLLVPGGDAKALADALLRILTNPGLATTLGEGIETASRTYLSWSRIASKVLGAYRRALDP